MTQKPFPTGDPRQCFIQRGKSQWDVCVAYRFPTSFFKTNFILEYGRLTSGCDSLGWTVKGISRIYLYPSPLDSRSHPGCHITWAVLLVLDSSPCWLSISDIQCVHVPTS